MKSQILLVLLVTFASMVSACANVSTPTLPAATTEPSAVEDKASLMAALQTSSAAVETSDSITQDFFSPEGNIIKVNGADVQVFEYESPEAMENEASQVAPDGGSVGTSMMMWMDTPHFYKAGRIIAIYIGSDQTILGVLETAMGKQFAGR